MRTHTDGNAERYISIGENIGESRGLSKGEAAGIAMGIISTARDLGAPDAYIIDRLMKMLEIPEEEAKQYVATNSSGMQRTHEDRLRILESTSTALEADPD